MNKKLKPELASLLTEIEEATEKFLQPEISTKVTGAIKKIRRNGAIGANFHLLIGILEPKGNTKITHQNILDAKELSELQGKAECAETFKLLSEKFETLACKESHDL